MVLRREESRPQACAFDTNPFMYHVEKWANIREKVNKCLRILTGKKQSLIKLQRFRKLWICTFGCLVHQISSLCVALKLKQNFRKYKVVSGKTPFFVIGPFCTPHSICLNIDFWQSSFIWKCCVLILSTFN